MSNSVRYYSTKVSPARSLAEVSDLLRQYGAQRFEQVWEAGRTVAVRFNLPVPQAELGFMAVVLRPKTEVLARKLKSRHSIDDSEQVDRVAWRQLKGVLEGILMAVDTGMFTAPELLLGMAEGGDGRSLWQHVLERPEVLMLGAGPMPEPKEVDDDS